MYGHTLFPAYQFECIAVIDITFSTFRHRAPVVELDLEFQTKWEFLLARGPRPPLAPMKLRPCRG